MKSVFVCLFCGLILVWAFVGCNKSTKSDGIPSVLLDKGQGDSLLLEVSIELIPLETSERAMLENLQKCYVDSANDRVFILSDCQFYVFNTKGEFLFQLSVGRGPGEVLQISSFSANPDIRQICVLDMARNLKFYDYDGILIEEKQLSEFYSTDLVFYNADSLFLVCNYVGKSEKYFVSLYSREKDKIEKRYISIDNSPYNISTNFLVQNSFSWKEDVLICHNPNVFGLFNFDGTDFLRFIDFNLGNRTVPTSFYRRFEVNNSRAFRKEAVKRGYVPITMFGFYFKGYYMIGLEDVERTFCAVDSEAFDKVFCNGCLSSYFDLPNLKSLNRPIGIQKDLLVLGLNPVDLFEGVDDSIFTKSVSIGDQHMEVDINDNALLVVLR